MSVVVKTFHYYINLDERGEFYADVRDERDQTITDLIEHHPIAGAFLGKSQWWIKETREF